MTEETVPKTALPMSRVLSFATITAAGFVLGRISGLLREMVVSAHFGLSAEIDAYFLAYLVPTLINNIVAGSAITAAVMPVFARYLTAGKRAEFWYAASVITNVVLLITGVLTILSMALAGPIISLLGAGFPPPTQALAASLLLIMMPTLLLGAALNMLMAVLNSVDRFVGPALIFLALNVGIIGSVILLSPYIGIYSVALGFLIGVTLQVLVQSVELRRERVRYFFQIDWRHPALREVMIAFVPVTALAIVSQINLVIDRSMAAGLPTGSIGALAYADTILGSFYMLGISLGIAVFPSLSRMAATNDLESTAHTMSTALRLLIFILAPLTFLVIAFPSPIVGVILGRGKFDASAVQMTAQALAMYAIGLVAVGALYILQRAFYALSDSLTPFIVGLFAAGVHFIVNLILIPYGAHAGIALSASITSILGSLVLVGLLSRRVVGFKFLPLARFLAQCLALATVTALAVWSISRGLHIGTTMLVDQLAGIGLAVTGGIAYFVLAWLLRVPEAHWLLQTVSHILHRNRETA